LLHTARKVRKSDKLAAGSGNCNTIKLNKGYENSV
jgi:hypothetical protein